MNGRGLNQRSVTKRKRAEAKGTARPRATPRQQAAWKRYLELTGTTISQERIAVIRAQWEG
jgi:hypothetical protein